MVLRMSMKCRIVGGAWTSALRKGSIDRRAREGGVAIA